MPTTTRGRVVIPRSPKETFELSAKIFARHEADGPASVLTGLEDYDWETAGPDAAEGLVQHNTAERLKGEMEAAYRLRDAAMARADKINRASAAFLKGKYPNTPKRLAEWGFVVDDTPPAKKPAPVSAPLTAAAKT